MQQTQLRVITDFKDELLSVFRAVADATLGRAESYVVGRRGRPRFPPIFIVGQSRSGTTLLYQTLCAHLELVYLSNAVVRFPAFPALTTMLCRGLGGCDPKPSYESHHGITQGWNQPSSGYSLWRRWFEIDDGEMGVEAKDATARQEMIGTISWITRIYNRPFINKWTPNSARIAELARSFPNAAFLLMRRDLRDVAQSMLRARIEVKGDPNEPFVTWPAEYEPSEPVDYVHDIVAHIRLVEMGISSGMSRVGQDRFRMINYRDLCESPLNTLRLVQEFYYDTSGFTIKVRNLDVLPDRFSYSDSIKIAVDDYRRLSAALDELEL